MQQTSSWPACGLVRPLDGRTNRFSSPETIGSRRLVCFPPTLRFKFASAARRISLPSGSNRAPPPEDAERVPTWREMIPGSRSTTVPRRSPPRKTLGRL
jgi:hypothetical protein